MRTETITLPWPAPPMRSNDRPHPMVRARKTKEIRTTTRLLARGIEPFAGQVRIVGIWTVTDKRRRDQSAGSPTVKACTDGLVDAGVIPDDHWLIVRGEDSRIELGNRPGFRIEISEWEQA